MLISIQIIIKLLIINLIKFTWVEIIDDFSTQVKLFINY